MSEKPIAIVYSPASTIWITGVSCFILVAGFGAIVVMGFVNGEDMTGFAWATALLALVTGFLIAKQKVDRTLLFDDRIERRGILKTTTMRVAEIRGFRLTPLAVQFVGHAPDEKLLRVTPEAVLNPDFNRWMHTITDLEAQEIEAIARAFEARDNTPTNAKLVSRVATAISLAAAAWAWYAPSFLAQAVAGAVPPVIFALALWGRGTLALFGAYQDSPNYTRKMYGAALPESPVHSLILAWLMPTAVTSLGIFSYESQPPFSVALVAALFIPMFGAAWVADEKTRRADNLIATLVLLLGWAWSTSLSLQLLLQ